MQVFPLKVFVSPCPVSNCGGVIVLGLAVKYRAFCKSFTRHSVDKLFSPIYSVRKPLVWNEEA